jgi:hypothetical protein
MGVYLLQEEIHQKMDSARSNFFWHLKKKYHMASWELLASPKRAGELGFTNTRVMNKCLLAKWIFKVENDEDNMCCRLLRQKYLGDRGFLAVGKVTALNSGEVCWISKKIAREGLSMLWVMVGKSDSGMISGRVDTL